MERTGLKQKDIALQIFKNTDKNLSNKIRRNTIDFKKTIEWAVNEKIDLNWLLVSQANDSGINNVISIDPAQRIAESFLEKSDVDLDQEGMKQLVLFFRKIYQKRIAEVEEQILKETAPELLDLLPKIKGR